MEQDMSYIVVYQREDGVSSVEECGDLDLAIVTAERLRNVDSIERPRIFKTEEITYDFKPYYRVEVLSGASATESVSTETVPPTPPPPAPVAARVTAEEPAIEELVADEEVVDEPVVENVVEKKVAEKKAAAAEVDTVVSSTDDKDTASPSSSGSSGLFGTVKDKAQNAMGDLDDVAETAAEEVDATPPRRGLFGR